MMKKRYQEHDTNALQPSRNRRGRKANEAIYKKGCIRPPTSPYGASVLLTPEKDNRMLMCMDDRKINAQRRKDRHPLPWPDELIDQPHGAYTI